MRAHRRRDALRRDVRIIFPVAIPGILSAGIFAPSWNEFIYALIFMSSTEMKTVGRRGLN